MKLNIVLSISLMMWSVVSQANYTCSANPGIQYSILVQSDPASQAGYSATVNGVTYKEVGVLSIGDIVDFYSADGHFNLWISDQSGMNGVGFESTLSALATDDQNNVLFNLPAISATCSGSQ
jgi:hypothetical protein